MELLSFGDTGWGDELFFATLMTIAVSIGAMAIGFLFALIFTPLKLSKNKTLNVIGNCYTTIIRGVPELLVIYLLFFGINSSIFSAFGMSGDNMLLTVLTFSLLIWLWSASYARSVNKFLKKKEKDNFKF